jgi:CheY-like chemotaxis protein
MSNAKSILVLDDDPVVRLLLGETLRTFGFNVTACDSWSNAQAALAAGSFNLMMVDLIMPDMNGFDVIAAVRAERPDFPMILLSANADKSVNDRAKEVKPNAVLEKPWNSAELIKLITALTAGSNPGSA